MNKPFAAILLAGALSACTPKHATFIKVDDVTLGRVVVYRNGVAYYERRATVTGGTLTVSVPRERVDDFLKSLTVIDARTGKPLPVSIPREPADANGPYLEMSLRLADAEPTDVVLTYVTESPAWKPSYRVVMEPKGKVLIEGWAIVDNTSGEDWKNVLVGVGSSSALSFRYDLWSVRQIERETLQAEARFAVAPPTAISPYDASRGGPALLTELGDDEIRLPEGHPEAERDARVALAPSAPSAEAAAPRTKGHRAGPAASPAEAAGAMADGVGRGAAMDKDTLAPQRRKQLEAIGDQKLGNLPAAVLNGNQTIVIEGYADGNRAGASERAADRANVVRNQLISRGVAPARLRVVTKVEANSADRVRLVAETPPPASPAQAPVAALDAPPVGESHFTSDHPMSVARGSSVMVSMVRSETEGDVVYLYDAESERGNDRFAFRAVRLRNPTDSTLETGPVTVYGDGRFIGEGLTEPIPPSAHVVVPFALDRQIVVEKSGDEQDRLSRLLTLQRGVLRAEVQHVRRTRLTLTNRLRTAAKIYVRHTVPKGWSLLAPSPTVFERIGDAHLFEITIGPEQKQTIEIAEATPLERTLDLSADVTLEMMKVFVEAPEPTAELRAQLRELLATHRGIVDALAEQDSLRQRLADYRARMDELHLQLVTLQAVKTGEDLMRNLKAKMRDISDRVQRTTIEIVNNEEKVMLGRVRFQDQLAELRLPDVAASAQAHR
jgi:OmpA family